MRQHVQLGDIFVLTRATKEGEANEMVHILTIELFVTRFLSQLVGIILLVFSCGITFKSLHGRVTILKTRNYLRLFSACGGLLVFFLYLVFDSLHYNPYSNFWFGREKIRSLTVHRKSISNCLISRTIKGLHHS